MLSSRVKPRTAFRFLTIRCFYSLVHFMTTTRGDNFIMVPTVSVVAITMKLKRFKCLDRKQAYNALNEALLFGIPVDVERNFKGEYFTYVYPRGIQELRKKHNWKPPVERTNRHRPKQNVKLKRMKKERILVTMD